MGFNFYVCTDLKTVEPLQSFAIVLYGSAPSQCTEMGLRLQLSSTNIFHLFWVHFAMKRCTMHSKQAVGRWNKKQMNVTKPNQYLQEFVDLKTNLSKKNSVTDGLQIPVASTYGLSL